MVIGHEQRVRLGLGADQAQPQQRRPGQIEAGARVHGDQPGQFPLPFGRFRDIGEIDFLPGDLGLAQHQLAGPVGGLHVGDAQHLVPIQQGRGGGAQARGVDPPGQVEPGLDGVAVGGVGVVAGVEEQAVLQW